MDLSVLDINKICYEIANDTSWNICELRIMLPKHRLYTVIFNNMSAENVLCHALAYAKKVDYVDNIVRKLARKNGKDVAYRVFKYVFPNFNSITDLYDYCYNLCQENDVKTLSKSIGINGNIITYYARESKVGLMKKDAERLEKRKRNVEKKYPLYYNAVNFLYEHDKLEDIINYFENIDPTFQGKYLFIYASSMFPDKSVDEIKEVIVGKYKKYMVYKKSIIDVDSKVVEQATRVIRKFVDGDYPNILSFCTIEKIDKSRFEYFQVLVRTHNPDLHQQYRNKALRIKNREYSINFLGLQKIVNYITYGINGREFNILDYLKLTHYDVKTFYHLVENSLNEKEYHTVMDFYRKYKNMEILTEKYIFNENREFYCDIDNKGLPIAGTGHVVTEEEKKEVIQLIKNDGYELYGPVYNLYLKNYFNEEKRHVLKKSL